MTDHDKNSNEVMNVDFDGTLNDYEYLIAQSDINKSSDDIVRLGFWAKDNVILIREALRIALSVSERSEYSRVNELNTLDENGLLPCPFCGGKLIIHDSQDVKNQDWSKCFAFHEQSHCIFNESIFRDFEFRKWNTRAINLTPVERIPVTKDEFNDIQSGKGKPNDALRELLHPAAGLEFSKERDEDE